MRSTVCLLDKRKEAENTTTYFLEKPQGFIYLPGQYIYATVPILPSPDVRGNIRKFTLSSSPTEERLAITLRSNPLSPYKNALETLSSGDSLFIQGPEGTFVFDTTLLKTSHVFIAGGIGVTPFRSMIRWLTDTNHQLPIHLVYSNEQPHRTAFKEELDTISQKHPHIHVHYVYTNTGKRIDYELLQTMLEKNQTQFWISGPPGMVQEIEDMLLKRGVPEEGILSEKFTGYSGT